jgi:hypothetical protein
MLEESDKNERCVALELVEALVKCGSDRPLPTAGGSRGGAAAVQQQQKPVRLNLTVHTLLGLLTAEQEAACRAQLVAAGRGPELVRLSLSAMYPKTSE